MKFKRQRDWRKGRSIIERRDDGDTGQIVWKGPAPDGEGDVFLVRIGKDAARQVVGTKEDAKATLIELKAEVRTGSYQPSRVRMRFDTFLRNVFMPWKRKVRYSATVEEYARMAEDRLLPIMGHHLLADVTTEMLDDWVQGLYRDGLKRKTVRNYFSVVRACLRKAERMGYIARNPAEEVQWDRTRGDEGQADFRTFGLEDSDESAVDSSRVWSREEFTAFAEAADWESEEMEAVLISV